MPYSVKILADSVGPTGQRLTTFELTYPRFVHAEFMTHRMFSRNSASSRAIPIEKMIQRVLDDPVIPVSWGKNQKGMQAGEDLCPADQIAATANWLLARDQAIEHAKDLLDWGVHKQITNRLLEPWMWITVICSATEYANFFNLRCHPDAQPEIQKLAYMMRDAYYSHEPQSLGLGDWHLPLIFPEDREQFELSDLRQISVGRVARVSYLTHDGKRDPQADIELAQRLAQSGHWSPFEHIAVAERQSVANGNFVGFTQYRKHFKGENQTSYFPPAEVPNGG